MDEELDAVESFKKNRYLRKKKIHDIDDKIPDCLDPRKTKMIIKFNDGLPESNLLLSRKEAR